MRIFYRGPSIDASYHVLVHLAKQFQRRRLKYQKLTDDDRGQGELIKRNFVFFILIYEVFINFDFVHVQCK